MSSLINSALDRFSIPGEATGELRVIVSGEKFANIENHRGIVDFAPHCISLARKGGMVRILGSGLEIIAMNRDTLAVYGTISAIEME